MKRQEPAVDEDPWVLLEACTDPTAAQVIAGRVKAEGIPVQVSALEPIPGLEQNAEVHVPRSWLQRAQQVLAAQRPTDEELTELALSTPPEGDGPDGAP